MWFSAKFQQLDLRKGVLEITKLEQRTAGDLEIGCPSAKCIEIFYSAFGVSCICTKYFQYFQFCL